MQDVALVSPDGGLKLAPQGRIAMMGAINIMEMEMSAVISLIQELAHVRAQLMRAQLMRAQLMRAQLMVNEHHK